MTPAHQATSSSPPTTSFPITNHPPARPNSTATLNSKQATSKSHPARRIINSTPPYVAVTEKFSLSSHPLPVLPTLPTRTQIFPSSPLLTPQRVHPITTSTHRVPSTPTPQPIIRIPRLVFPVIRPW